jgi:hypothetical protein
LGKVLQRYFRTLADFFAYAKKHQHQVGSAYYNIQHLPTPETNHAGTSQQGATLAKDDDIQAIQNLSEQV